MSKTEHPSRVDRALALLRGALRYAVAHHQDAKAKRIRKGRKALLVPHEVPHTTPAPPPAPPKPVDPPKALPQTFPAIAHARAQSHHGPAFGVNECRLQVRLCYGFASVGDFDGDGAADAEDGWKAAKHKHPGDRKAPRGYPVYWGGGSTDNGHIAISAGVPGNALSKALRALFGRQLETWVWSTDIRRPGFFDYVPLSLIEEKWGLPYLGWTEDDNGHMVENGAPA